MFLGHRSLASSEHRIFRNPLGHPVPLLLLQTSLCRRTVQRSLQVSVTRFALPVWPDWTSLASVTRLDRFSSSYATMSIFSTDLLHSSAVIDQVYETRIVCAKAIGEALEIPKFLCILLQATLNPHLISFSVSILRLLHHDGAMVWLVAAEGDPCLSRRTFRQEVFRE